MDSRIGARGVLRAAATLTAASLWRSAVDLHSGRVMSDLLVRDAPVSLNQERDERLARAELRRQIGRLEHRLSRLVVAAFPRLEIDARVAAVSATPRALGLGELERVRDELAERIGQAELSLKRRTELETSNRRLLEQMLADPAKHKGLRISRADVGEPGCGGWLSQPRLGMLGMLMGWWRVKVSSGCPL